MIALFVILGALLLLLFLPVSLCAYYDGKFRIAVRILFFSISLPFDKEKKAKPEKTETPKKVKTDNRKLLSQLGDLKRMLPSLLKHAFGSLTISRFRFFVTVGSDDPFSVSMTYGAVNAAVYTVVELLGKAVKIKNKNIRITPDFQNEKTEVEFEAFVTTYLFKLLVHIILLLAEGTIDIKSFTKQPEKKEK